MNIFDDQLEHSINRVFFSLKGTSIPLLPQPPMGKDGNGVEVTSQIFRRFLPSSQPCTMRIVALIEPAGYRLYWFSSFLKHPVFFFSSIFSCPPRVTSSTRRRGIGSAPA
jgi:hypothetical protein